MSVWPRLAEIRSLRFSARSATKSGWNGAGCGSVAVGHPSPNTITFVESGTWQPEAGRELVFSNVFRWSRSDSGESIRLEHLRRGSANPITLFDLVPRDKDSWHSATPHVCGDDLYSADLTTGLRAIELLWTVRGPKKNEEIHYWYHR